MKRYNDVPEPLISFLMYIENIQGKSQKTAQSYYYDLRAFYRFLKMKFGNVSSETEFDSIDVSDVDLSFVKRVDLNLIYEYMNYINRERQNGPTSRARKIATLRSFFNYLTLKVHLLEENPIKDLDSPKLMKSLPKYLTFDESIELLSNVDCANQERDFCILTLFLNCGLRISELIGLNLNDIQGETLRILGKGNKVRIVYLNDACKDALSAYMAVRRPISGRDQNALFLSSRNQRISRSSVHALVKKHIDNAGLDSSQYSAHKLRHTAATLMLQNGVDVKAVQEVLGHEHLNTTEIYTHIDNDALRVAAKANPLSKVKKPARD